MVNVVRSTVVAVARLSTPDQTSDQTSDQTRTRDGRAAVIAAVVVGSGCLAAALIDPAGGPTLCPFKAMTQLDCPLCGATRAAHALFRGNVVGALDFNAVFVLGAPLLLWTVFVLLRRSFGGRAARLPRISRPTLLAALGAVGLFTIVRNLGTAPFDWLSSST